jgi:hypothetical protein
VINTPLLVAVLLAAACTSGQAPTSRATPTLSPGSGLVLLNDTKNVVTAKGCQGCDAGVKVGPGERYHVTFKPNNTVLHLTSTRPEACIVVVSGVGNGDLLLRASAAAAGAC